METIYIGVVVFLFALAVIDLAIGVSNDAVNFLNSAVGARAGSYKTVLLVAAVGIFFGSAFSNGMMDLTRHGIFQPEHFSFGQLMNVFLAVMVADIILLDIFNSLGLPTSTTVSRVFELLGASFTLAAIKILTSDGNPLPLADYINTDKALTVILAIFISVAIAFIFGVVVQYIVRLIFSFNFLRHLQYKIGVFGGVCFTGILYFMLIKGLKDMSFMTSDYVRFIDENTGVIVLCSFCFSALLSHLLYALGVNVLRVVVLFGTLSLAMAFAGNDLVNFIGVPITGFECFGYFSDAVDSIGVEAAIDMPMAQLNDPSHTPIYFLILSGLIMVVSLLRSEKAKNVVRTSVSLSSQDAGDEMFGSSRVARHIVRQSRSAAEWFVEHSPKRIRRWTDTRFDASEAIMPSGAAFDMVRASVNLVLAGLLVALGTSWKLPLSTTYVTFMVAMGTSLADRAWGRETAVFRITGVISVIGGWIVTAAAAFLLAALIVTAMHLGGIYVSADIVLLAIFLLVRSNISYNRKARAEKSETEKVYEEFLASKDRQRSWSLLRRYVSLNELSYLSFFSEKLNEIVDGFVDEDVRKLRRVNSEMMKQKLVIKATRRRQTLMLRKMDPRLAIENNTWLHLAYNSSQQMLYCLMRMCEPCLEHVDNNFAPIPEDLGQQLMEVRTDVQLILSRSMEMSRTDDYEQVGAIRSDCDVLKDKLSRMRKQLVSHIHEDMSTYSVVYVYLNMLQEAQEMISSLRHNMRALKKLECE